MPTSYSTLQYKVMDRVKSFFGVRPPNYDEEDDFSPLQFTEVSGDRDSGWASRVMALLLLSAPVKHDSEP